MYKKDSRIRAGSVVFGSINDTPMVGTVLSIDQEIVNIKYEVAVARPTYYIRVNKVLSGNPSDLMMEGYEWATKGDFEIVASELFTVGDVVQSTLAEDGAKFEVTGFEEHTNRVICLSLNKRPTDRFRYAYKTNELRLYFSDVFIQTGEFYRLNKQEKVVAAEYPSYKGLMQLIVMEGKESGKIYLMKTSEGRVSKDTLERAGITHIVKA